MKDKTGTKVKRRDEGGQIIPEFEISEDGTLYEKHNTEEDVLNDIDSIIEVDVQCRGI